AAGELPAPDSGEDVTAEAMLELPELPERLREAEEDGAEGDELPVTRLEALLELNRLADDGRHTQALPLADRLIELTAQEFGDRSLEAAGAHETAARVQREAGQHNLAEQNY